MGASSKHRPLRIPEKGQSVAARQDWNERCIDVFNVRPPRADALLFAARFRVEGRYDIVNKAEVGRARSRGRDAAEQPPLGSIDRQFAAPAALSARTIDEKKDPSVAGNDARANARASSTSSHLS